jgi:hypothetical protein
MSDSALTLEELEAMYSAPPAARDELPGELCTTASRGAQTHVTSVAHRLTAK